MPSAELDAISTQCDEGRHDACKSTDCACICHDDELEDPEDDEY